MEIALAAAGVFVTILVIVAMVLIVPRGAEPVHASVSNLSEAPEAEEAADRNDFFEGAGVVEVAPALEQRR